MARLTGWVLRHKVIVIAFWIAVLVVGIATVARVTHALSEQFSAPGEESYETNLQIIRNYDINSNAAPIVLVATLPRGTTFSTPQPQREFTNLLAGIGKAIPGTRILSFSSTGDRAFISADGRTTYALVYLPMGLKQGAFGGNGPTVKLIQQMSERANVGGAPVQVTGIDALTAAEGGGGSGPSLLVETLFGGAGALVVLAFVFGSFIAIIPLFMAAVAIMSAFLLVWGVTTITPVSFIVEFLIGLIGLGVAIDYSLLIIVRWREERAEGWDNDRAVEQAMATAGHAVVFSGTAVGVGLLAMVALPIPALRSVGFGGLLIPIVSVAVATTLLPVMLATIGPRLDWPRLRSEAHVSRPWSAWAHLVVRHRWLATIVAVAILGALFIPAIGVNPGSPVVNSLAKSGEARDGLVALEDAGIGAGPLTPISILVRAADPTAVISRVASVSGVRAVVAPNNSGWRRAGTSLLTVIPSTDANGAAGHATIDRVRAAAHSSGVSAGVAGDAVSSADFTSAVYANFPLMLGIIAVITFILLARALRSLILPLKALILNVLSIGAAWGVMVLVFQHGYGSKQIWGITATGALTSWVPLFVFAFLFGLSMDYEVFLLARMREEYDRSGSTNQAVVEGLGRTGRLVTGGALILFLSFVSLATVPDNDVKVLATGLAVGILLDATIVRALLVPAVVSLMGDWNWWLPSVPARLLRVKPSIPIEELAPVLVEED